MPLPLAARDHDPGAAKSTSCTRRTLAKAPTMANERRVIKIELFIKTLQLELELYMIDLGDILQKVQEL